MHPVVTGVQLGSAGQAVRPGNSGGLLERFMGQPFCIYSDLKLGLSGFQWRLSVLVSM